MRRILLAGVLFAAACDGGGGEAAAPTTTSEATTTTTSVPSTATTTAPTTTAPPQPEFTAAVGTLTAEHLPASWRPGCPVPPEQLRRVTLTHWGFDGTTHTGTVDVHQDHADAVIEVFRQLFALGFPIERMEPVDVYGGSDDASMAVNNTSAFNCRAVTGGTTYSQHSYGWAIDINPRQNPYVTSGGTVLPPEGAAYTDRSDAQPGMILAGDAVVQAFESIGWSWGGYWSDPNDYQHFSATGR